MNFKSNNNRNSNGGGQKEIRRQQTTTQQIIAENVKHLIEQLEQGKSEALTAYLSAMARFHNYSFGNILSIAHHRPDASRVHRFHRWPRCRIEYRQRQCRLCCVACYVTFDGYTRMVGGRCRFEDNIIEVVWLA